MIYGHVCYGCSACAVICPVGAISMKENEKGFLMPSIAQEKCIHCGKCISVCRQKVNYHEKNQAYIARLKDEASLRQSQSGGAFTAISNVVLKQGGAVYGAVLNSKFEAQHMRAASVGERDRMRGSKYVQSDMGDMYRCVERDLEERTVLFTGTPCQIAGLNKYLSEKKKNTDNLLTVDLICHGVPSVKIWRDLIKYYEEKEQEKVINVVFRSGGGWGDHVSTLMLKKNGFLMYITENCFTPTWH